MTIYLHLFLIVSKYFYQPIFFFRFFITFQNKISVLKVATMVRIKIFDAVKMF
jgi:hypothetical protein